MIVSFLSLCIMGAASFHLSLEILIKVSFHFNLLLFFIFLQGCLIFYCLFILLSLFHTLGFRFHCLLAVAVWECTQRSPETRAGESPDSGGPSSQGQGGVCSFLGASLSVRMGGLAVVCHDPTLDVLGVNQKVRSPFLCRVKILALILTFFFCWAWM